VLLIARQREAHERIVALLGVELDVDEVQTPVVIEARRERHGVHRETRIVAGRVGGLELGQAKPHGRLDLSGLARDREKVGGL
jgi:hypothetical protein